MPEQKGSSTENDVPLLNDIRLRYPHCRSGFSSLSPLYPLIFSWGVMVYSDQHHQCSGIDHQQTPNLIIHIYIYIPLDQTHPSIISSSFNHQIDIIWLSGLRCSRSGLPKGQPPDDLTGGLRGILRFLPLGFSDDFWIVTICSIFWKPCGILDFWIFHMFANISRYFGESPFQSISIQILGDYPKIIGYIGSPYI